MHIRTFGVEQWMNEYETRCSYNLAETCVESLTVGQLLDLTGHRDTILDDLLPMKLTYGAIEGSDRLRGAVAATYEAVDADQVSITHGAIGANQLVYLTLVEPGDRVISIVPNYQQHYSIPESLGATVELLPLDPADGWLPDLDRLADLVANGAKAVTLSNPNNPTGAVIDESGLRRLVEICDRAGAWLVCDEVYRGMNQQAPVATPSVAALYDRGIGTGSMSKAFSLAGLRLGWIVGPVDFMQRVTVHRDYNTISVGMVDDLLAAIALEHADVLLERSRSITRGNLATLTEFIDRTPRLSFVAPRGGTTALLDYGSEVASRDFCVRLIEETGVMLTPGSALDVEGYVRIGFANNPSVLAEGLAILGEFLAG